MTPFALAAAAVACPCPAAACVAGCPVTFVGPYLPAVYAGGPNPAPDVLGGAPPYFAPAPLGFVLPSPAPVPPGEPLSAPTPLRFGPTGVPPRLGPVHLPGVAMPRSVLLLLLAASAPSADPRVIRLTADDPPAVEASGLSAPQLAWLRKLPADDPRWAEPLRVYVVGDDGTPARTPLLGGASLAGDRLRFVPRFPLAPGGRYRAVFDLPPFPETPSVQGVAAGLLAVDLTVPRPAPGPATVVAQVYPTADRLPANVLRLYVQFSAPMSRGGAYQYLTLFDAAGKALPSPFLELEEELWSADGTRFTLYFHPGRVKRGLESRDEAGPALDEGKRYTLAVSADWPDAAGRPLRAGFRKEFRVGPADFDPIDPERWILVPPAARDGALVVRLPKPLDRALLGRLVTVTDAAGRPVPGRASVGGGERVWTFAPDAGWAGGEYRLVVDPRLEDPCGNRVGEPFEIDEARPAQQPREAVSRPFSVR